ncbi:MAG: hypothetical protein HYY36_07585 [Gammaproteobacteria bacterium]|nr:hypothetical protein [Gammaproteobacteria bacterium]
MMLVQIVLAAALASAFHALALRITVKLMVEVTVNYGRAFLIVAIEYLAIAGVVGALLAMEVGSQTLVIVAASVAYLFVGAAFIGSWFQFENGTRVGVGNGVLIQAIQIPLIIPVLIVGSFLFDIFAAFSGSR